MMDNTVDETALLIAQAGPLNGQRWVLRGSTVLGRDPSCDIVIEDRQVSRRHAVINMTPQGVLLEDLGSKNGTHHNGQPINGKILLADGDLIQVALAQKFTFLSSDATVPLEDLGTANLESAPPTRQSPGKNLAEAGVRRLTVDKRSRRIWLHLPAADRSAAEPLRSVEVLPALSAAQFNLLELLYESGDEVVARQTVVAAVWGLEQAIGVSEQALDALIRRLRERLNSVDPSHEYILTLRGHGLRLDNPVIS